MAKHIFVKNMDSPIERAEKEAVREKARAGKLTPLRALAESGQEDFTTMGAMLELLQAAANLKRERERQGLSLAKLSEMAGVDQEVLARLESGRGANPTHTLICKVAEALGKRVVWSLVDKSPKAG